MVSSYDRTGGNNDWATFPSATPGTFVEIANLTGPGIVHRIWMTGIENDQELAFFLDGESGPRLQVKYGDFFGKVYPFVPPLCDTLSFGHYSYVPIPFGKSIRIALSVKAGPPPRAYYQINYEQFAPTVVVESYPRQLADDQRAAVERIRAQWTNGAAAMTAAFRDCDQHSVLSLAGGESKTWLEKHEGGILRAFGLKVEGATGLSALQRARLLRGLVLRLTWDGTAEPSVNVPLGDFFANGLHQRDFVSLPLAVMDGTFLCRFPMPFAKGVKAEIVNDTDGPVSVSVAYALSPLTAWSRGTNYFHASLASTDISGRLFRLMQTEGVGHLVGCYLTALGMDGSWKLLEGDDIVTVDDNPDRMIHGTGLDDCFNGGWYYDGLYALPLHGLLDKAATQTAQYRLLLPDRISFSSKLSFDWEFGEANQSHGYMSAATYWYQSSPHPAGSQLPPLAARFPPPNDVERAACMASLLELDRAGLMKEARTRCQEYRERYPGTPEMAVLALREAAYREMQEGYAAVSNSYRQVMVEAAGTPLAEQARLLSWFHEADSNQLLGIQINGHYRLYVDRIPVSEGDSPAALTVVPVTLAPGEHEVAVSILPTRPMAGLLLSLRTHSGIVAMTGQTNWCVSLNRPAGWPAGEMDATPGGHRLGYGRFPTQENWQLVPNAFAGMQSVGYIDHIYDWPEWRNRGPVAYFRVKVQVPPMRQ